MKTEKIRESILGGKTSLGIELGSTRIKGILVIHGKISSKTASGHIISTMFGRVCANATERLPMM